MYDETPAQKIAMAKLAKEGFKFSNWIPASPDADGNAQGNLGCVVMVKRETKFSKQYREVDPSGDVN